MKKPNFSLSWNQADVHPLITAPRVNVVLLDCSESMRRYETVALSALNQSLAELSHSKSAYRTYVSVIGFGATAATLLPFKRASDVTPIHKMEFSRGTRLFEVAYLTLEACSRLRSQLQERGQQPQFSISLISDGIDNISHHQYERRLRECAMAARDADFNLRVYAVGADALILARDTGFPADSSYQLSPVPEVWFRTMSDILRD